jgi:heme exporter protein CcmD
MNFDVAPYGMYIWPAYGLSVLVLGAMIVWTLGKWRAARARLAALEAKK